MLKTSSGGGIKLYSKKKSLLITYKFYSWWSHYTLTMWQVCPVHKKPHHRSSKWNSFSTLTPSNFSNPEMLVHQFLSVCSLSSPCKSESSNPWTNNLWTNTRLFKQHLLGTVYLYLSSLSYVKRLKKNCSMIYYTEIS